MSSAQILLLGALAGLTIVTGLPMGRLQDVGQSFKAFLSATATGILLFLLWDVLVEAIEPVEDALNARDWCQFSGYSALAFGGFAIGLLSLVYYDSWMKARRRQSFLGPGAASAAALDKLSLAYVLVIGFGLHNATEGFGIVAPLTGDAEPPSWRFLALMGAIGGFPTFFGTVVGQAWTSTSVSILFLALAAGSILYVVMELLNVCRLFSSKTVTAWGLLLGLTLGFATDFVLVDAAPLGVKTVPVEKVVHELPPALIDLALWIADYYGSTPARALELVAPVRRQRRKEQASPVERQSLEGEAAPAELSDDQKASLARIAEGGRFLLYGPTGSGKTEVYLQAAAATLERGLGTIVLVPEIALAPQTVGRFRARFGDSVALLHSGLTDAERRDERERIARGDARIVVGARSAIFAPMHGVGLICVDEEHDPSYKQESDPRYDARTVAAKRAALEGASVVYGSATPRPESWAALERLELRERVGGKLPPGRIVDLPRGGGYPPLAPLFG